MKKKNIIIHAAVTNYINKAGTSSFQIKLKKWLMENKDAQPYHGDLRREKVHFKEVHEFYAFQPKIKYNNNMYKELNCTYVIF